MKGLDLRVWSPLCTRKIKSVPQRRGGTPAPLQTTLASATSSLLPLSSSVDRLVTLSWVGYFGVSPGSDSYPHYKPVLGPDKLSYVLDHVGNGENIFYVEGLAFPDAGFSGLVSFSASLLEVPHKVHGVCLAPCKVPQWWGFQPWCFHPLQNSPGTPIFTDTVVFRVAPWIMTPNTQQPVEVFVCR